jgi:hypothetical protein
MEKVRVADLMSRLAPTRIRTDLQTIVRPRFRLEEDLVEVLQRKLPRELVSRDEKPTNSYPRLAVGMTIPDLVVTARAREKCNLCKLSFFECAVVSQLVRRGALEIKQLERALFARSSNVHRAVSRLENSGLISVRESECRIRKGVFSGARNVVSIEAKLNRWKEALDQAKTYRNFSNSAYVALPEEKIRKTPAILAKCVMNGVGLLAVGFGRCTVVFRAPRWNPRTTEWVWLVSRTVGFQI